MITAIRILTAPGEAADAAFHPRCQETLSP